MNNQQLISNEDFEKILACEDYAIKFANPVFDGTTRFLFLFFSSANWVGISHQVYYQYALDNYLFKTGGLNGFNGIFNYCRAKEQENDIYNIIQLKHCNPPIEFQKLETVIRFAIQLMRNHKWWDESNVNYGVKSSRLKSNLVLAIYRFIGEEYYFNWFASGTVDSLINHVRKHMILSRNVITDKLQYTSIFNPRIQGEMTVDKMWFYCQNNGFDYNLWQVQSWLNSTAVEEFDPFRNYFNSIPEWDGVDHIGKLASHVKLSNGDMEYFKIQLKKHLVRSVACSLGEEVNRFVLVFSGEKQYTGKSTFIQFLTPPVLIEYYCESPLRGGKDDSLKLSETFIINLEELSTLSNRDVNELKAFISAKTTNERRPYARSSKLRVRRTNFFASTNRDQFLVDDTGNTRWLVFSVDGFDWKYKAEIDINKVWAQAYHLYRCGETGLLTQEEIVTQSEINKQYEYRSIEHEAIMQHFLPVSAKIGEFWSTVKIHTHLTRRYEKLCNFNQFTVGRAMKQLGFVSGKRTVDGQTLRGWFVQELNHGEYNFGTGFEIDKILYKEEDGLF